MSKKSKTTKMTKKQKKINFKVYLLTSMQHCMMRKKTLITKTPENH